MDRAAKDLAEQLLECYGPSPTTPRTSTTSSVTCAGSGRSDPVTDLRDQLAAHITCDPAITHYSQALRIADRLIETGWRPGTPPRTRTNATCHTNRPVEARGLCKSCYTMARERGELDQHPVRRAHYRTLAEVVDLVQLLDGEGATTRTMAGRLGMTPGAFRQAYRRAVKLGLLTPDRKTTA